MPANANSCMVALLRILELSHEALVNGNIITKRCAFGVEKMALFQTNSFESEIFTIEIRSYLRSKQPSTVL